MYLDHILIYTNNNGDGHVSAVRWVLEQFKEFSLFANLKKCRFHQEEVWFLGYIVSSKGIRMEDEKIETIKQWPEPQSAQDIWNVKARDNPNTWLLCLATLAYQSYLISSTLYWLNSNISLPILPYLINFVLTCQQHQLTNLTLSYQTCINLSTL